MRYVVGIDAGGTKTLGVLADASGKVCAEARGGGANLQVHGASGVEKVLGQVIAELSPHSSMDAICLGVAGVDRPADREVLRGILERLGVTAPVRVENDAYIALVAGAPERTGIALVAGTGSIAYGVDFRRETGRAGGWGYLLADEGSGFWLGHRALRSSVRAADGRGPATVLVEKISRQLGLEVPAGLVPWAYCQTSARYSLGELAPLVAEAAEEGDAVALEIIDQAAQHLSQMVRSVARQLTFPEPYPLVLSGGVLRDCALLVRKLKACMELPQAHFTRLTVEPARGAVSLALDLLQEESTPNRDRKRMTRETPR